MPFSVKSLCQVVEGYVALVILYDGIAISIKQVLSDEVLRANDVHKFCVDRETSAYATVTCGLSAASASAIPDCNFFTIPADLLGVAPGYLLFAGDGDLLDDGNSAPSVRRCWSTHLSSNLLVIPRLESVYSMQRTIIR
eukprot:4412344-Amphidinium_carterae.3